VHHSQEQVVVLQVGPVGVHMVLPSAAAQAVLQQVLAGQVRAVLQARMLVRAALLLLALEQLLLAAQMQPLLLALKQQGLALALLQQQLLLWLTGASQAACGLPLLLLHLRLVWWTALPAWPAPLAAPACPAGTARHAQPP
jgi:hypothetical protein